MAPVGIGILIAGLNFTSQADFPSAVNTFIIDRSPIWNFMAKDWDAFAAWLAQPQVYAIIIAWAVTFTLITTVMLTLGFGPAGVGAGTAAAAFQATMYGGFTPAGGIFATLTSLGMLGILAPVVVMAAASIATIAAMIVWACGVGS